MPAFSHLWGTALSWGGKNYLVPSDAKFAHCSSRALDRNADLNVPEEEANPTVRGIQ